MFVADLAPNGKKRKEIFSAKQMVLRLHAVLSPGHTVHISHVWTALLMLHWEREHNLRYEVTRRQLVNAYHVYEKWLWGADHQMTLKLSVPVTGPQDKNRAPMKAKYCYVDEFFAALMVQSAFRIRKQKKFDPNGWCNYFHGEFDMIRTERREEEVSWWTKKLPSFLSDIIKPMISVKESLRNLSPEDHPERWRVMVRDLLRKKYSALYRDAAGFSYFDFHDEVHRRVQRVTETWAWMDPPRCDVRIIEACKDTWAWMMSRMDEPSGPSGLDGPTLKDTWAWMDPQFRRGIIEANVVAHLIRKLPLPNDDVPGLHQTWANGFGVDRSPRQPKYGKLGRGLSGSLESRKSKKLTPKSLTGATGRKTV
jgi:hypothetical protein